MNISKALLTFTAVVLVATRAWGVVVIIGNWTPLATAEIAEVIAAALAAANWLCWGVAGEAAAAAAAADGMVIVGCWFVVAQVATGFGDGDAVLNVDEGLSDPELIGLLLLLADCQAAKSIVSERASSFVE